MIKEYIEHPIKNTIFAVIVLRIAEAFFGGMQDVLFTRILIVLAIILRYGATWLMFYGLYVRCGDKYETHKVLKPSLQPTFKIILYIETVINVAFVILTLIPLFATGYVR